MYEILIITIFNKEKKEVLYFLKSFLSYSMKLLLGIIFQLWNKNTHVILESKPI